MKVSYLSVAKTFLCLLCLGGTALSQNNLTPLRASNLAEVPGLNVKTENSLTPLQEAVLNSDAASVRHLLKQGADPNVSNRAGVTALMLAVTDPVKLKLLLEHGANVNAVSAEGKSALILAAAQKRAYPAVKLLLSKGAQVNQRDKRGSTALLMAARNGDVETLRLLLAHGADPHAVWKEGFIPPENGANALDLACNSQNIEAVKLLLERNVRLDKNGRPLLFAAMNGSLDIVQLLLAAGASVNIADPGGYTPLMHATLTENAKLELLKLLLERGADPQAQSRDGKTARAIAERKGWAEAVALLQQAETSK